MGDIALTGGVEIEVLTKSGSAEKVKVLCLAIEHMLPLIQATDDEIKQVALYCGKDEEWAKSLNGESQERVVATGEKVNGDFLERWSARRIQRALTAKKQVAELADGGRGESASASGPPRPR